MTLRPTFVVPHTWPNVKNAEYEVLLRLARAAKNIGARMIAIDNSGYPLWDSDQGELDKGRPINTDEVAFMISLHFESPRLIDTYSYYALWQPLDFYFAFGYAKSTQKMLTHLDCLSCGSDLADTHARNLIEGVRGTSPASFPFLYHSPPEPYYEPSISERSKLFYVGINWERINNEKGRYHELLVRLDEEDLIDIYGPEKFMGVEPWRGFKTYKGELPFDGQSVVRAVAQSGICLALSSGPHQQTAIMSNRLFEGLAAGAALVANSNPFIDKYFADVVHVIDDNCSPAELYEQVHNALLSIRADPVAAREKALIGQKRLSETFSLEKCLQAIIDGQPQRKRAFDDAHGKAATITVVAIYLGDAIWELEQMVRDIVSQRSVSVFVSMICRPEFVSRHSEHIKELLDGRVAGFELVAGRTALVGELGSRHETVVIGQAVHDAVSTAKGDFLAFVTSGERWLSDHLATLAGALDRNGSASLAVSGALKESLVISGTTRKTRRELDSLTFTNDSGAIRGGRYEGDAGRFLVRVDTLRRQSLRCLTMLDGLEAEFIRTAAALKGALAQTGLATYVKVPAEKRLSTPSVSISQQRQYIADAFASDPEWIAEHQGADRNRSIASIQVDRGLGALLKPDTTVPLKRDADGLRYLGDGFSSPETNGIWIDGQNASLAFQLHSPPGGQVDWELQFQASGRPANGTNRQQHCTMMINGMPIAYQEIVEGSRAYRLRVPRGLVEGDEWLVEFALDHADQVVDAKGDIVDERRLGMMLQSFGVISVRSVELKRVGLNTVYHTRDFGNGADLLLSGFYSTESDHVWMGEGPATLGMSIDGAMDGNAALFLGLSTHLPDGRQKVECRINGFDAGVVPLRDGVRTYGIKFPSAALNDKGNYIVELRAQRAGPAYDGAGRIADPRILGVALSSVRVGSVGLPLNLMLETNSKGDGARFLGAGFSSPEAKHTWIDGKTAVVEFVPPPTQAGLQQTLVFFAAGRGARTGRMPSATVMVGDVEVGSFSLAPQARNYEIPLPSGLLRPERLNSVTIKIDLAEPVSGPDGRIVDPRRLGFQLIKFGVFEDYGRKVDGAVLRKGRSK